MKAVVFLGAATTVVLAASCGGSGSNAVATDGGTADGTSSSSSGGPSDGSTGDAHAGTDSGGAATDSGMGVGDATATCGTCPSGYTCGTANGLSACRAPSGIPLFSNVYVILMENTSLTTLNQAMTGGTAPNLEALAKKYATAAQYHGVAHPSLPNYVALTSGGVQGIGCDCEAQTGAGT